MGMKLKGIERKFRDGEGTSRPYGFDFSGLKSGTDIPSGEIKGIYGNVLKDTASGWTVDSSVPLKGALIANTDVSTLDNGYYEVTAAAGSFDIDFDAAGTAGTEIYLNLINMGAFALTLDVGAFAYWGATDKVYDVTDQGKIVKLFSDGLKWSIVDHLIDVDIQGDLAMTGDILFTGAGPNLIDSQNATATLGVRLGTNTSATAFEVQNDLGVDYLKITGDANHLLTVKVNSPTAYLLEDTAGANYLLVDTTTALKVVTFGNATTNPAFTFLGTGVLSVDGNISIATGLDIQGEGQLDITTVDGAVTVAGGAMAISTGAGGAASGAVAAAIGGAMTVTAGAGGASDGTGASAAGATLIMTSGTGGAGSGAIAASAGGLFTISGGAGGAGTAAVVSGNGASLTLRGGAAGADGGFGLGQGGDVNVIVYDFDVNATNAVELDGAAASHFTIAGASLTLSTTAAGDIIINSVAAINIDGATVDIDSAAGLVIGGTNATSVSIGKAAVMTTVLGSLNVDQAATFDLTVGVTGLLSPAGGCAITGDLSYSGHKLLQSLYSNVFCDVAAATWTYVNGGHVQLPASQAGSNYLFILFPGLKEGDIINGYKVAGYCVEGAALTLDCDIVEIAIADGTVTGLADNFAPIVATAAFDALGTLTTPEVVSDTHSYAIRLNGTTGLGDTIDVIRGKLLISRK